MKQIFGHVGGADTFAAVDCSIDADYSTVEPDRPDGLCFQLEMSTAFVEEVEQDYVQYRIHSDLFDSLRSPLRNRSRTCNLQRPNRPHHGIWHAGWQSIDCGLPPVHVRFAIPQNEHQSLALFHPPFYVIESLM